MHEVEQGFEIAGVILVLILSRGVYVYCRPFRECRMCRKGGVLAGSLPGRTLDLPVLPRRKRRCWRCKGTKLTRRLGAQQMHKMRLSVQQAMAERAARPADRGGKS